MSTTDPGAQKREPLLDVFETPSNEEWKTEVERLLRGAPFAKKMFTKTLENITISPNYRGEDTRDLPGVDSAPGQWPYLRGTRPKAGWLVAQEILLPTAEEFNNALRSDLKRGQTAVNLVLDRAGLKGRDPDQAQTEDVGAHGTSIASLSDLMTALDGVHLEAAPLFVQAGSAALPVLGLLLALLKKRGASPADLRGCLGSDPAYGLAQMGKLPLELDRLYDELAVISRWAATHAPQLKTLPVHEDPWHDGGADSALSLGLTLASAVAKLRAMEERGIAPEQAAERVQFHLCMGSDFFMELSKVRALRVLWAQVLAAAGCPTKAAAANIHARTSRRVQTLLDAHVNMLRVTTQAMSAVLGGVDSLHVSPFDEVDSVPDEFSRRIARNVHLLLAHECHFDQVQDPAGGSWYVETLTHELGEKAWGYFQEIEKEGGIIAALEKGKVQEMVAAVVAKRTARLATRRDVLIGTNQFANPVEKARTPRVVDHALLQRKRGAAMTRQRTSGAHHEHRVVLGHLEKIITADQDALLDALVEAAAAGATLGELCGILRHDTNGVRAITPIPLRRDAEPFEQLRAQVTDLGEKNRVFACCLGDVARYMPRLDFTRGFFQAGGFTMVEEGFYTEASAAAEAAAASGAPTVVLVGLDGTYEELAGPVVDKLSAGDGAPRIILAGGAPEVIADLESRGLDRSINLRSDVLDVLGVIANELGVQA
ncbi:methylmalonyl-CoA mutase [bacterium DOLZORAL124_64_63]|nr:MAG: methylmalonyl-CoA mutase [bacterium DOLZORAL124_64_63]